MSYKQRAAARTDPNLVDTLLCKNEQRGTPALAKERQIDSVGTR